MKTRFYYTMAEVVNEDVNPYFAKENDYRMNDWLADAGMTNAATFGEAAAEVFENYIWPKFCNEAIVYVDVESDLWEEPQEPTSDQIKAAIIAKLGVIYSWFVGSNEKYSRIVQAYKDNVAKLMDRLGSTATTLFNDTPQSGGDVTTSSYITNATTATTTADVGTPMARLKEIQDNLDNVYITWSNEFRKFILL